MRFITKHTILAVLVTMATTSVYAQQNSNPDKIYYNFDRVESKSNWLMGTNPAGLVKNMASISVVKTEYNFEEGKYSNVGQGDKITNFGLGTESFLRDGKLSFYGKLGYNNNISKERNMYATLFMGDNPMFIGSESVARMRIESYGLSGGVAYQLTPVASLGFRLDYNANEMASRRDPRSSNSLVDLTLRPGVMFEFEAFAFGLNANFKRRAENIDITNYGTNQVGQKAFLFEGLWFYDVEGINETIPFGVSMSGNTRGGSVQFEVKIAPGLKFYNQLDGDYTTLRRFSKVQDQQRGDTKELKYSYLGGISYDGGGFADHTLKLRGSYAELYKYNNIQESQQIEGSTNNVYVQFGKILKYKQDVRTLGADYSMYVKRNGSDWANSWIFNLGWNHYQRGGEYSITPVTYSQKLKYNDYYFGVTKFIHFENTSYLEIGAKAGMGSGKGNRIEVDIPQGVIIDNISCRNDLLNQEFEYFTNDRYSLGGNIKYVHPLKRLTSIYAQLNINSTTATSGAFIDKNRALYMGTVGICF